MTQQQAAAKGPNGLRVEQQPFYYAKTNKKQKESILGRVQSQSMTIYTY